MFRSSYSNRRVFLGRSVALIVWVALPAMQVAARSRQVRVLFICEFGTAKSAVARELFRRRVRERGLNATAFSRGLEIADHVSPRLHGRLIDAGIDTTGDAPVKLSRGDIRHADLVVAFAKLPLTSVGREVRDWSSLSSLNDDYDVAMPDLQMRIDRLIDDIAARQKVRR